MIVFGEKLRNFSEIIRYIDENHDHLRILKNIFSQNQELLEQNVDFVRYNHFSLKFHALQSWGLNEKSIILG